jgi:hypothetical protein
LREPRPFGSQTEKNFYANPQSSAYVSVLATHRTSPNNFRTMKLKRMRLAGHVARVGDRKGACRILVGRPEGKRTSGISRRRWEDNIKMDLEEVG